MCGTEPELTYLASQQQVNAAAWLPDWSFLSPGELGGADAWLSKRSQVNMRLVLLEEVGELRHEHLVDSSIQA